MTTQALEVDRESLIDLVGRLPDRVILQAKGYIERLCEEEALREAAEKERRYQSMSIEEIDAEITALRARYGTTPNARTIAAMKEAEAGLSEPVTIEEIRARCNAIR